MCLCVCVGVADVAYICPEENSGFCWFIGQFLLCCISDFVDSAPIEFDLYPQDHLHIVVNWTADNMLQNVAYEIQVSRTENFNVIESVSTVYESLQSLIFGYTIFE